ncbi:MAG: FliM/FliN family flagellar motor switch protein [Isosphaeraceae bacterium]
MDPQTLSTMDRNDDSRDPANTDPFGGLPRLSGPQVRLERWLAGWTRDGRLPTFLEWLEAGCGGAVLVDRPEVIWRASGLSRPGMIAHLTVPRLGTRLAVGIENPLAHAVVDRLLGFDREFAETRDQLTPVEWGIWTFLILRVLDGMDGRPGAPAGPDQVDEGSIRPGELRLDRAGPDPFNPEGLGAIVTVRWGIRVGEIGGSVRLWMPEALARPGRCLPAAGSWLAAGRSGESQVDRRKLGSVWRAEAGTVALAQGLKRLRAGAIVPFERTVLSGTPGSLEGPVDLVLDLAGAEGRFRIPARPVSNSGGRLVRVEGPPRREPAPRQPIEAALKGGPNMSPGDAIAEPGGLASGPDAAPLDVPVTLAVELGRVNLTVGRLAELRPGEVIELARQARAPVELTSNGRVVARGELILIDTELGVRVTSVFL